MISPASGSLRPVFVSKVHLVALANVIRGHRKEISLYLPGDMPEKIRGIDGQSDFIPQAIQGLLERLLTYVQTHATEIRENCFQCNPNMGDGVELEECLRIRPGAFAGTKIVLVSTDKCWLIESKAFQSCSQLASVALSSAIREVASDAFAGCGPIAFEVDLSENSIVGFPWGAAAGSTITWTGGEIQSFMKQVLARTLTELPLTISEQLTAVKPYCFEYCAALAGEISLPLVQTIGTYAFRGCSSITKVSIGSDVTSIGSYAFSGCSALTQIEIAKPTNSISGKPWGAPSGTTVVWTG